MSPTNTRQLICSACSSYKEILYVQATRIRKKEANPPKNPSIKSLTYKIKEELQKRCQDAHAVARKQQQKIN
jgi:hypothetical protein